MATEEKRRRDIERAKEWRRNNPDAAKEKDRIYREKNAEKIKITQKASRQRRMDKIAETSALWYEKNREHVLELKRKSREENRDEWNKKAAEWRRNNIEKQAAIKTRSREKSKEKILKYRQDNKVNFRIYAQNRRQRIRCSEGRLSLDIADKLMLLQKSRCPVCNTSLKNGYHLDHILPISKGGLNDDSNIQLLCPSCNVRKNAKDPIVFMQERGYLL